jgi:2-polyprenyl-3-methyl-5-hydroxy-6-metoxy-1,4-benzoquinol methylase
MSWFGSPIALSHSEKGTGELTTDEQRREQIIHPTVYVGWRNSRLGSLTESIEQRAILSLCGDLSGRNVLDLGCGDGTYAQLAARKGASSVVGLDISPEMLTAAHSRAAAEGV